MARGALVTASLFGPAALWLTVAGVGLAWTAADDAAWANVDRHGDPVAGSDRCVSCHPEQWRSWHRSWHRTMTQRPDGEAGAAAAGPLAIAAEATHASGDDSDRDQAGVLAPFAGEHLDYGGFRATMDRDAEGRPRIVVVRLGEDGVPAGEPVLDVRVALTVGSHRYQQYVAYLDRGGGAGELWRLPVAWHRAEQRWIHLNGAFVEPEGEVGSLPDYERHLSRWNDNCIFCHNTEAAPGRDLDAGAASAFASRVGELGIACEACHGPATAHLERHRQNPLRRLLASNARGDDGSITNPASLDPARETEICGRCHGQRIARDIAAVMREGDGFVAGDVLAEVSRPILVDSVVASVEGLDSGQPFAARFWPDGTPRLSAYEYQGLLLSPCFDAEGGEGLGCGHCHDMHGDEPDAQVRSGRGGAGGCLDCHELATLGGAEAAGGHGGHARAAPEVDCLDCHMPPITYGLLEGMISHRITNPDPGAWVGRDDQPDACTQCHVDRSRLWAAQSMAGLGLRGSEVTRAEAEAERAASRVVLDLIGGDPIQRNLAAHALALPGATGTCEQRMAWIAEALDDEYPSVRWFAWRGLRTLAARCLTGERQATVLDALADFDYLGSIDARIEASMRARAPLGPGPLADEPELRERLMSDRWALAIWIGE